MSLLRAFGVALVFAAFGVALVLAALAAASSAAPEGATSAACSPAGLILGPKQGPGRLDLHCGPCPGQLACKIVKARQILYKGETLSSKNGTISFYSTEDSAPDFTCQMSKKTQATFYPPMKLDAPVVLQVEAGAISCEVRDGAEAPKKARAQQAILVYGNTAIRVTTLPGPIIKSSASSESADATATSRAPLFAVKVKDGSLKVQVKRGAVAVGTATSGGSTVPVKAGRQRVVGHDGAVGASTPLVPDPELESAFLVVHPNICEQNVVTANGENTGSHPQGLATDRNGDLWFTDDGTTGALGIYHHTSGKIAETTDGLNPGSVPRWITSDTKGTIWFTDDGTTPAIGTIDPATHKITEYSAGLNPGSVPWAIDSDPVHGLLWFTDQGTTPAIGTIDPATHKITEYSVGLNAGSHPEGIAVDGKGNVWFTDDNDPRPAIGMLDAKTKKITEYETGLVAGSLPRGIVLGPDGHIWFADQRKNPPHNPKGANHGLIGTIDPTTHKITEYDVGANGGNPGSRPEGLARDTKGNIWFTEGNPGKPAIGLIKPLTGAIVEKPMKDGSAPMGLVVTPAGGLWFVNQQHPPKIGTLAAKSAKC